MSKDFSENYHYHKQPAPASTQKSVKIVNKPKRVIMSKKLYTPETSNCKSYSSVKLSSNQSTSRPKKTTRSDFSFSQRKEENSSDYCKSRGDYQKSNHTGSSGVLSSNSFGKQSTNSKQNTHFKSKTSVEQSINSTQSNEKKLSEMVSMKNQSFQQYYKNENFLQTSASAQENDKCYRKAPALGTIKELSESQMTDCNNLDYLVLSEPSNTEKLGNIDPDNKETLQELKQFRNKNYFECHSSQSRIKTKGDVTGLTNHKCVYRFYLNDRLFPVPLCTDHNKTIRCVECLLPLEQNKDLTKNQFLNGSIQTKVRFGSDEETKDMTLFLPVKENLIIRERRMARYNLDPEVMYFGVVKLDGYGNSVFSQTSPGNSFALRYQKGFKQNETEECCRYSSVDKGEVMFI